MTYDEILAARHKRFDQMKAERIVSWSPSLQRWLICNGFAKILATVATKEEAERVKSQQLETTQLPLL